MTFAHIVSSFFTAYLRNERGLAPNTIASYSDAMARLLTFASERFGIQPEQLSIEQIDRQLVLDFLDHLEAERGNSASTRNQRLAAIKTFFRFLARNTPALMHHSSTIQAIRKKAVDHHPPPSLSLAEVQAMLAVPDPDRLLGARDKALLQLLHNSGARVQEIADLRLPHLQRGSLPTVTLTGKGGKTRTVPLWPQTVALIDHYLTLRQHAGVQSDRLFLNINAEPITRFGIGRRIGELAHRAAASCPSLHNRRVTPHVLRHTTALHLVESNNDLDLVKDWLGHADIKTTSAYLQVSVQRKQAALAKVPPPAAGQPPERPQWNKPGIMAFLKGLCQRGVMLRNSPTTASLCARQSP